MGSLLVTGLRETVLATGAEEGWRAVGVVVADVGDGGGEEGSR